MTTPTPCGSPQDLPELLPCPFCGSAKLNTEDCRDFVACANCGTEGPIRMGQGSTASIEAWNRRAARQQAVPAGYWMAPMEPDEAMRLLVQERQRAAGFDGDGFSNADCFRAMRDSWLSRHPAPQQAPEPAIDVAQCERDMRNAKYKVGRELGERIGHRFEAQYDEHPMAHPFGRLTHCSEAGLLELLQATKTRVYRGSVCARCGIRAGSSTEPVGA